MTGRATFPDDMTEARIIRGHGSRILRMLPTKDCWCSGCQFNSRGGVLNFSLDGEVILRYVP